MPLVPGEVLAEEPLPSLFPPSGSHSVVVDTGIPGSVDTDADLPKRSKTLSELYEQAIGRVVTQAGTVGVMLTGYMPMTPDAIRVWRAQGRDEGGYEEVFQVRSSPKGRIGMLLVPGEVRRLTVLVRPTSNHMRSAKTTCVARVTSCKFWLVDDVPTVPDVLSYGSGVYGCALLCPHLFSFHGRRTLETSKSTVGRDGYHLVLCTGITTTNKEGDRMVSPCPIHTTVLASAFANVEVEDLPSRRPPARSLCIDMLRTRWDEACRAFSDKLLLSKFPEVHSLPTNVVAMLDGYDVHQKRTAQFLASAHWAMEDLSGKGLLDWASDPFFQDALPDCVMDPNDVGLVLASAAATAMLPQIVGLQHASKNDAAAAADALEMLHSIAPAECTAPESSIGRIAGVAAHSGLHVLHKLVYHTINALQTANVFSADARAGRQIDCSDEYNRVTKESLSALHQQGVAMLTAAFGDTSTSRDPVLAARTRARRGGGAQCERPASPLSDACTNDRQLQLAKLLLSVETSLVAPQPPAPVGVPVAEGVRVDMPHKKKNVTTAQTVPSSASVENVRFTDAALRLSCVLNLGLQHGTTHAARMRAFAISPQARQACGLCGGPTHVVASIGFAGTFGGCAICSRAFCLQCVQGTIDEVCLGLRVRALVCQECSRAYM